MKTFPPKYLLAPKPVPELVEVRLPGSKSYTNRALLLSALAEGTSTLSNALFSDDTERMVECLGALGIEVTADSGRRSITVHGKGKPQRTPQEPLYCGNAGTAIRFLTPFCAFGEGAVTLTGNERMRERPIADLIDGMRQLGGEVVDLDGTGCPPIRVSGGGLRGGVCQIEGTHSSQYFSALLLSAARMRDGLVLEVQGDLVSKPYIDMTLAVMARFGIQATHEGYKRLVVPAGQQPKPIDYVVEGDASGASYFLAAAAITGKKVRVGPLPSDTCQGDRSFVSVLERMGCRFAQVGDSLELAGGPLHGIEADLNAMSDTAQTLAVTALFAEGPTTIRNIANVRIKETDRIAALSAQLARLGARVEEFSDGLTIHPAKTYHACEIETYDDHRMAMSFALAGLRVPGLVIQNPGCVTKTFPDFFELFAPWMEIDAP
jgi:3-phosphoshikimate 1-carboxyvinyltransferase